MSAIDTENNPHVWIDLEDVKGLNRKQIEEKMIAEAKEAGFKPSDYNGGGRPEIYLRSKYNVEKGEEIKEENWVCDGYVMFIEKVEM